MKDPRDMRENENFSGGVGDGRKQSELGFNQNAWTAIKGARAMSQHHEAPRLLFRRPAGATARAEIYVSIFFCAVRSPNE